jgi:hypothetical protein
MRPKRINSDLSPWILDDNNEDISEVMKTELFNQIEFFRVVTPRSRPTATLYDVPTLKNST